jgi:hypothetical protein
MESTDEAENHVFEYGYVRDSSTRIGSKSQIVADFVNKSDPAEDLVADFSIDVKLKLDEDDTEIVNSQHFDMIKARNVEKVKTPADEQKLDVFFDNKFEDLLEYYNWIKQENGEYYGRYSQILTYFNFILDDKLRNEIINYERTYMAIPVSILYDFQRRVENFRKKYNKFKLGYWRDEPKRLERLEMLRYEIKRVFDRLSSNK